MQKWRPICCVLNPVPSRQPCCFAPCPINPPAAPCCPLCLTAARRHRAARAWRCGRWASARAPPWSAFSTTWQHTVRQYARAVRQGSTPGQHSRAVLQGASAAASWRLPLCSGAGAGRTPWRHAAPLPPACHAHALASRLAWPRCLGPASWSPPALPRLAGDVDMASSDFVFVGGHFLARDENVFTLFEGQEPGSAAATAAVPQVRGPAGRWATTACTSAGSARSAPPWAGAPS